MRRLVRAALFGLFATRAWGATLEAWPGDDLKAIVNGMSAGDTLILHGGTYDITSIKVTGKNGSDSNWTTIRAAEGESPVLRGSTSYNGIDIKDSSYVHIKGLEIYRADVGLKFDSTGVSQHHVLLEDLKVHEIDGVGISGPGTGNRYITVRRCEVYDTGRASTGEGVYISYFDKEVRYLTIESCWIHDLNGSQSDGIDIKLGRGCIIRDNVIHGCQYPAMIVRGSGDALEPNIVERNVVWGSGAAGIETYGDCIVRNNIVFNCSPGLYSRDDASYPLRNVEFINNTVYDCNPCLDLHDWGGKSGMLVANNALYRASSGSQAVYVSGGLGGVTVTGNIYYGTLYLNGAPSTGLAAGGSPTADMLAPASCEFYPTSASALIDAAVGAYAPAGDFNGTARPFGSADDVGAYEWTQAENPGWSIGGGFKDGGGDPPPDGDGGGGGGGCGVIGGAKGGLAFATSLLVVLAWWCARRARLARE